MKYQSTETFTSKLIPDVTYTLKKMSHGRRVALNLLVAPLVTKGREIEREWSALVDEIKEAEDRAKILPCICSDQIPEHEHDSETGRCKTTDCMCRDAGTKELYERLMEVRRRSDELYNNEQKPAYIKWALKEIHGLEIDGVEVTPDTLLDSAPEGLVDEIVTEIFKLIKLTTEEQLAFPLVSTSGDQVDAPTQTTIAAPANSKDSTKTETAVSTSPKT